MSDIAVTDTAFTGFRVVREQPFALLFWALASLIFSLAISAVFLAAGGKIIDPQMVQADPSQTQALLAQLAAMAPAILATAAVALVVNCIAYGAMNRAILRPQDKAFGFLRFGIDELRLLGAMVLLAIVFFSVYFGLVVVVALCAGIAALGGKVVGIIVGAVTVATALCIIAILAVRLSLVLASTFDTGKISLGGSWALTRGRFWPILGTYFLATALTAVVVLLAWLVEMGVGALVLGSRLQEFLTNQPQTIGELFTPVSLLRIALGAVTSALIWPLTLTPSPSVYKQLVAARGASLA
jgi:hypothetical protein